MMLTDHFSVKEFEVTQTKMDNSIPNFQVLVRLYRLCRNVLEPIRSSYGGPIRVTSGYRDYEVNRLVGGVPTSQHRYGYAADITAGNPEVLFRVVDALIKLKKIEFDQIIFYRKRNFIHVSYKHGSNRNMVLEK